MLLAVWSQAVWVEAALAWPAQQRIARFSPSIADAGVDCQLAHPARVRALPLQMHASLHSARLGCLLHTG